MLSPRLTGPEPLALRGLWGYICPSSEQLWQISIRLGIWEMFSSTRLEYGVYSQVSSFTRYESYYSLSLCDWRYYTLAGFNNGFKARARLWFSIHPVKWCVVIEREPKKVYVTLLRREGITWRPQSSDLTCANNDVTHDMKSSQV